MSADRRITRRLPIRGFESSTVETSETAIHLERGGAGPPVLLHGFPQSLAMWRDVAPILAETPMRAARSSSGASSRRTSVRETAAALSACLL